MSDNIEEREYIWGLDLSLTCSGVAIITPSLVPIYITSIDTSFIKAKDDPYGALRLRYIAGVLTKLRKKYPPKMVAIERMFISRNDNKNKQLNFSPETLGKVHGAALAVLGEKNIIYYPPTTIKATICKGNSDKKIIQKKLKKEFPLVNFNNDNESDALATAVTYLIKEEGLEWNKLI